MLIDESFELDLTDAQVDLIIKIGNTPDIEQTKLFTTKGSIETFINLQEIGISLVSNINHQNCFRLTTFGKLLYEIIMEKKK